jgi:copper homeostasis protein
MEGLTPDIDLVSQIMENIPVPVKIMIRPRPGDFEYSAEELKKMADTILEFKMMNPAGFVLGCTVRDSSENIHLDMKSVAYLCHKADPVPVTIHKAIDICTDICKDIEGLKKIHNVKYILSSGGSATAEEGLPVLQIMAKTAHPHIKIIAAGRITSDNIIFLHSQLKFEHYHGRRIVS